MGMTLYIIEFTLHGIKYNWSFENNRFESKTTDRAFNNIPIGAENLKWITDNNYPQNY